LTARSLHDVVTGKRTKVRRTYQPVRRNSHHRGEREDRLWRPIDPTTISARLRAAEQFDTLNKKAGDHSGPLGNRGLRVLRELYRIVDYKTGRLEPSIDTICRRVRLARATVVAALAALKEHGFLDWIRRTEPTENTGGAGPQVVQITNAYWFKLPRRVEIIVNCLRPKRRLAPPVDRTPQDAPISAEPAATPPSSHTVAGVAIADPGLAAALARLEARVEQSASSMIGQNPA